MMQPDAPSTRDRRPGTPIVLLGASVRAAACSARLAFAGGTIPRRIIGVDQFGDRDTREACDEFHCLPQTPADTCRLLDQIRSRYPGVRFVDAGDAPALAGLSLTPSPLKHPDEKRHVVAGTGMVTPETVRDRGDQLTRLLSKSLTSSGGLGVQFAGKTRLASDACSEPYVAGRVHGAALLSTPSGVTFLGVCRSHHRRFGNLPFVYSGSSGPIDLAASTLESVTAAGQRFARSSGHVGLLNVDFVGTADGQAVLLEINPRYSASMEVLERAASSSLIGLHLNAIAADTRPADAVADRFAAAVRNQRSIIQKRIVYSLRDGTLDERRLKRLQDDVALSPARIVIADIPMSDHVCRTDHPLMTLIFESPLDAAATRRWIRQAQACVHLMTESL